MYLGQYARMQNGLAYYAIPKFTVVKFFKGPASHFPALSASKLNRNLPDFKFLDKQIQRNFKSMSLFLVLSEVYE